MRVGVDLEEVNGRSEELIRLKTPYIKLQKN